MRGVLEGTWQQRGDLVHGNLAGIFAGLGAAHPVAYGKGIIMCGQRRLAEFAQAMEFKGIETQG